MPTFRGRPAWARTPASAAYGQNSPKSPGFSQQHSKGTPGTGLTKPQVPRVSAAMGGQNSTWQHQGMPNLSGQPPGNSTVSPFTAASSFHLQQAHLKMSSPQFSGDAQQTHGPHELSSCGRVHAAHCERTAEDQCPCPSTSPGAPQQGLSGPAPAGPELGPSARALPQPWAAGQACTVPRPTPRADRRPGALSPTAGSRAVAGWPAWLGTPT